jgi:hypothetical protein
VVCSLWVVARAPWLVARSSWLVGLVASGSWLVLVVHGLCSWFVARGSWLVVCGSWLVAWEFVARVRARAGVCVARVFGCLCV